MRPVRTPNQRDRTPTDVGELSRTKQSFKDECDINNILDRYTRTGILEVKNLQTPLHQDNTIVDDLKTSLDLVNSARAAFDGIDAHIRAAASNDPVTFLKMLEDRNGRELLEAAGLQFETTEAQEPLSEHPGNHAGNTTLHPPKPPEDNEGVSPVADEAV